MATIYKRKDSEWYWLRYKTPEGKWACKATRYRTDNTLHRDKAMQEALNLSIAERTKKDTDYSWVIDLIRNHPVTESTRWHYRNSWRHLARYMDERGITLHDFTPAEAHIYIGWRTTLRSTNGKTPCRNLALDDLKCLKWIQRMGRLHGRVTTTAMMDWRTRRDPVRKRPIFTDEEILRVRRMLDAHPDKAWMQICFEIGYQTGCRLRETRLDMRMVDLQAGIITFHAPKGGQARAYTIPIPSGLRPLLAKIKATGATHAFDWPGAGTKISREWRLMLNLAGLPSHTFHSLRTTRVTNLRKAGVPQSAAMRLVNHSSSLVHELYQRHFVEDLRQHADAGLLASSTFQTHPETPSRAPSGNPAPAPSAGSCRTQSRTRRKADAC